jgi:alginate O-acetyltransferase complex protein AlgJ
LAPSASSSTDDLFGDADLPNVVVIGTSFSRTSNFVPFIEKELKAKVANLARSGGDFSGAMNAYLSSVAFKKTPPKLVIWEIPERVLQQKIAKDLIQ